MHKSLNLNTFDRPARTAFGSSIIRAMLQLPPKAPRLMLAPMEGVVDHTMRELLTGLGGIDRCITEFVRVSERLLPPRVFRRYCPELAHGGRTASGVPVYLQLLGGQPGVVADNAARAAELGAPGIDLNFGCPAKTVNRSDGGSIILRQPERVHAITAEVRRAVPAHIPVTVKTRLGYEDPSLFIDIVRGIAAAGATELTVHARTKRHGYRPPAFWEEIARARELVAGATPREQAQVNALGGFHLSFIVPANANLGYSQVVGVVLILSLMIYVTYNDLMRWVFSG